MGDNVVNGLPVVAAFESCNVFDAPFVDRMSASSNQSSDAGDGGPLTKRKVKSGKVVGDGLGDLASAL